MQRHQLHAVFPCLALPFAGFERGVREECGEFGQARFDIFRRAREAARDVDQFVEVLDARFGAAAAVLFVEVAQAGAGDRVVDLFGERREGSSGSRTAVSRGSASREVPSSRRGIQLHREPRFGSRFAGIPSSARGNRAPARRSAAGTRAAHSSRARPVAAASARRAPLPTAKCSSRRARWRRRSSVRSPMPRGGVLTARSNAASSWRLATRRRYASASLISARSKKRRPP